MSHKITAVHLDAIGGIAGDMFVATILDAKPNLWPECQKAIHSLKLDKRITARIDSSGDPDYKGTRFIVDLPYSKLNPKHQHIPWVHIRQKIKSASLDNSVRDIAIDIFSILANAEALVHDISPEDVSFHEVGASDSIIDIVVAAVLINALSPCVWSVSSLPQGRGQINSQHGYLPLPAPASAKILEGYVFVDDGESGERITPTGAAILKYLNPNQNPDQTPRRLLYSGMGFGQNRLQHRANALRAVFFGSPEVSQHYEHIEVLRCEIDDQTAEDLATAIDHLRVLKGVLDVCQWPVYAKKGRVATALQVLTEPDQANDIIIQILNETSTLGVRRSLQNRAILSRQETEIGDVRVKLAQRPRGVSAKAEMDDIADRRSTKERQNMRVKAEARAKEESNNNVD